MSISFTETGGGADILLVLTDTGTCDDSGFAAGIVTDAGSGDDSGFGIARVSSDAGAGTATLTVAVAAPLAEAGTGDDLPWEFISAGAVPLFPYYSDLPQAAEQRVRVGDRFLWYAGG